MSNFSLNNLINYRKDAAFISLSYLFSKNIIFAN